MAERSAPPSPPAALWGPALTVLAAASLNLLFYDYSFGTDPHIVQVLPLIRKINDAGLYPNDPYLAAMRFFRV